MAQPWQRSAAARDFSLEHIDGLSDREAAEMLAEWRWERKGAQVCPKCGVVSNHIWRPIKKNWRCKIKSCEAEFSVTSGTPFAGRHISLKKILKAIVLFVNSAHSISADALMRNLGITSKTAWLLRAKLRDALSKTRPKIKFGGVVQVDGMYVCVKPYKGNKRRKMDAEAIAEKIATGKASRKRMTNQDYKNMEKRAKKRRVIISIRKIGGGSNQASYEMYAFVTNSENERDATAMIRSFVEPGTLIMSDECPAYNGLVAHGYEHRVVQHSLEFVSFDGTNDNQCESFNSRLRRAEYGVFHNLSPQHLQSIVDEFVWREDTRHLTNREKVSGLVRRVFNSGLSKFRGYHQRKDKRGKEERWESFRSAVNGSFGEVQVSTGG